ncbi:F-box domain-containing protein 9, partial [Teratosphaeria destructans]
MDHPAESSITQVLRLPELLELILLHLPQRDILLCQRTTRHFRQTVEGSIRLQRALFLAPDWHLHGRASPPYAATTTPPSDRRTKPENNRILRRAFDANYPTVTLHIENHAPIPSESAVGQRGTER